MLFYEMKAESISLIGHSASNVPMAGNISNSRSAMKPMLDYSKRMHACLHR